MSSKQQIFDIKGLTPGIDLRNSEETFALGGKNFAFTSKGPRSMFGDRFLLPHKLGSPEHAQGIRVRLRSGDRVFTFIGDSMLEWVEGIGGWVVRWITPVTNVQPYRWTHAYINGIIYFCHPAVGILAYNLDTEVVKPHEGPGVPRQPLAICANSGRLIVLDSEFLTWSWQSDGMNFTPALGEAGFQKVNDRVAGFPIMVSNYAQGVVTWTTGGMMRSEFTGDQEVYRHRNLNTEFRPVNSFCSIQMDDNTCLILDERGLFASDGQAPAPLAPLFNEFLIEYIRKNNLGIGQNIRIEWDDLRRHLYVLVSLTPNIHRYEKAFVLYPTLDKWGSFNERHYGILPVGIQENERGGMYFGFVDMDGRVRYWHDVPSREVLPLGGELNLRYPRIQKPAQRAFAGGHFITSSTITFNSEPQGIMTFPAGFYANESDTPADPNVRGLDAKLQIGLIRFDVADSFDHLSEVTNLMIGNIETGPEFLFGEDYNQIPDGVDDEDYQSEIGKEDFGFNTMAYVNHDLRIISTVDGRSTFQEAVPELIQFAEGVRHFSCSTVGIWHILELSANSPGQAFHLRACELNAVDAGKLS